MKFLHKNKSGETVELPIRVLRDPEHKEIYAHGAFGAHLANYHFRIDFYKDIFPPIDYELKGDKLVDDSITHVERRVMASVYLPLPFLKELKNWLDRNIQTIETEYGEIRLPKNEEIEPESASDLPKVKEA